MKIVDICAPRNLAELYLRHGSVEEVLKRKPELPISSPDFHRKIKAYGIVKGAGRRQVSLAEVLNFFGEKVVEPNLSIESLYRKMSHTMRESVSLVTVYRIYQQIMERMVRTYAATLVITTNDLNQILVVDEQTQNIALGKVRGNTSIPMSFAAKDEPFFDSVLRVMQREFSTSLTLDKRLTRDGDLTKEIIPSDITPFMYLHILDAKVAVFHMTLPDDISNNLRGFASSYKVNNHRFLSTSQLLSVKDLRQGVGEIIESYKNYSTGANSSLPIVKNSLLNEAMLAFPSK